MDRGIADVRPAHRQASELQWGRDQWIAEFACDAGAVVSHSGLQWGRDQWIAELAPLIAQQVAAQRGFNGAAINGSRNCTTVADAAGAAKSFNGAAINGSRNSGSEAVAE